jgi:hypothetical protein
MKAYEISIKIANGNNGIQGNQIQPINIEDTLKREQARPTYNTLLMNKFANKIPFKENLKK